MPRRVFTFDHPDRFIAGALGQPGRRTFFLQASKGTQIISVALEKAQVAVLAERIATLLLALRQRGVDIGEEDLTGTPELSQPIVEEFRVGVLTLGWNPDDERVVIEARELAEGVELDEAESEEEEEEDEEEGNDEAEASAADELRAAIARLADAAAEAASSLDVVRVQLEPNQALQFASGALAVVQAGRPPCPMCGQPLEPTGHFCTRRNGYTN